MAHQIDDWTTRQTNNTKEKIRSYTVSYNEKENKFECCLFEDELNIKKILFKTIENANEAGIQFMTEYSGYIVPELE